MRTVRRKRVKTVHSLSEIPPFSSEDEEREWWATHDLSEDLYDQLRGTSEGANELLQKLKTARTTNRRVAS